MFFHELKSFDKMNRKLELNFKWNFTDGGSLSFGTGASFEKLFDVGAKLSFLW